jgi:hypothetical protein
MEERLDDAINVLRNHAESVGGGGPQSALPGAGPSPALSHSNGIMAAYPPVLEPLMVHFNRLALLLLFSRVLFTLPFSCVLGRTSSGQQHSRAPIVLRQFGPRLSWWLPPRFRESADGRRPAYHSESSSYKFK